MANISELQLKFTELPMSEDNIGLYEALLSLDISDFKPLMEEILLGRLDIEDTRKLFSYTIDYSWLAGRTRLVDPRISTDIGETIKQNLLNRISGDEDAIIKEGLIFPDKQDLRYQIAQEFKGRTGLELAPEDVEKILPIVESELYMELSISNPNAVKDKDYQLRIADLLSFKPKVGV